MTKKSRILMAVSNQAYDKLGPVLSPHFELSHVVETKQALGKLRAEPPDAVIATLLFDESRMFEFLNLVKSDPDISSIPFIACRAIASRITHEATDSMTMAALGQGAARFLDFVELCANGKEEETVTIVKELLNEN